MILQNPMQVATSTIQNTYGAILSTANKVADTTPTNAVSDYAVPPSASSPVLSAFFQTLSQIDQGGKSNHSAVSSNTSGGVPVPTAQDSLTPLNTTALQEFTYSLFQNLQGRAPNTPGVPVEPGLGPLPTVTPGPNTTYLNNLPTKLSSLSATLKSANPTGGANSLEGLKAAYQSLLNSIGTTQGSAGVDSTNSASLASFLEQMSQNLQAQNVTSISPKGSLLDTKA